MKDRILESYLTDFAKEHGFEDLDQPEIFERFVNYCLVSKEHSDDLDIEQISVGGNQDTAIDGLAILVNDHLVSSKEDINFFKTTLRRLDAKFIFIQSKIADKFNSGEIGNFLFGVKGFFRQESVLKENDKIRQLRALKEYIYKSSIDMDASPICRMYYTTTGKWVDDGDVRGRIDSDVEELRQTELFSEVEFIPIDANKLKGIYRELKLRVTKEITFDKCTILPQIAHVQEAYIGILPCLEYLKLITDSEGGLLRSLFNDNVRDFQGHNPVNREIQATLTDATKNDKFVLLNNGITVVAKSINKVGTAFKIKDYQIVNGCQTSHVLFNNRSLIKEKLFLPIKIIVTDDPDVTNLVIKATNWQTEVKLEAFEALSPFQKTLEEFYNTYGKDKQPRLYYERRSKQYENLPINRQQVVSLTAQVKSFAAMFLNEPHSTHRYYGELLRSYRNKVFLENHSPFPYYVSGCALCVLEGFFSKRKINRFFRQFKYQMLLLFRIQSEPFDLPYLNAKKIDSYCSPLLNILFDEDRALHVFKDVAAKIDEVLKNSGHSPTNAVRLRAFTASLIDKAISGRKTPKASSPAMVERESGQVSMFSDVRGFGFIKRKKGDDAFVHFSDIRGTEHLYLKPGQLVEFTLVKTERGLLAKDVIVLP